MVFARNGMSLARCCAFAPGERTTTAITFGNFSAPPRADRNAFLLFTVLVWIGGLSGFVIDSFKHVRKFGLNYPLIVHFHAAVFVGYLALFTTQVALIRNQRLDIHRKLGTAGAALAAPMLMLSAHALSSFQSFLINRWIKSSATARMHCARGLDRAASPRGRGPGFLHA